MKPYLSPRWSGIDLLDIFIEGFEKYINLKYNIKTNNVFQVISFYNIPQAKAFDKFFELLEDFLRLHPENLE